MLSLFCVSAHAGDDGVTVHAEFRQRERDGARMDDVRFSRFAELFPVSFLGLTLVQAEVIPASGFQPVVAQNFFNVANWAAVEQ